nr:MAG TPA: Dynactin p62 family [Caudoviricetes sp.]
MIKGLFSSSIHHLMPINVDNDCFHCPVCTHYHKLALSDILPGLKRRCNREGAVIVEI